MAFSFSNKYNVAKLFDVDTTDFEYFSLEDIYDGDDETIYVICGVYINTRGLYDDAPVIALEDRYINLPAHLTKVCQQMIEDPMCVKAINAGKCGFKIRPYHQNKYDKDCFSVEWVDV